MCSLFLNRFLRNKEKNIVNTILRLLVELTTGEEIPRPPIQCSRDNYGPCMNWILYTREGRPFSFLLHFDVKKQTRLYIAKIIPSQ